MNEKKIISDELKEAILECVSKQWHTNTERNKPVPRHSVLMKTKHGIAEGEWLGDEWLQYRWMATLKDGDVLSWKYFSEIE